MIMKNILEVKNLCFHYDEYDMHSGESTEGKSGINDVSFSIPEGAFVTLCGSTGSGKSTLLKLLKRDVITSGKHAGDILLDGINIDTMPDADISSKVGLLFQNPEDQIVTDKVWHEIVFGMENLGLPQSDMDTRLAEALAFFRLESISRNNTATLSGGQKQLVSLAGVLAMYPRLLLLDEPTSQLDPEAAEHYVSTIKKLQSSLGLTVIIAEHNLDKLLPVSDMLMVMDKGSLVCCADTPSALKYLAENASDDIRSDLPLPTRFGIHIGSQNLPMDISSGRKLLARYMSGASIRTSEEIENANTASSDIRLKLTGLSFRYTVNGNDIIENLNADFKKGCIYSILGCNASGKSTLLNLLAGNIQPQLGRISPKLATVKIAYMPQDTDNMFVSDTIEKELLLVGLKSDAYPDYIAHLDKSRNPLDLSGGEKQLLGLAKITALKPELLLLDEPTKGTDNLSRVKMVDALLALRQTGTTIIMACHDMSFASECADVCAILSMGRLTSFKSCHEFFTTNQLYTTPARTMTAGLLDNVYREKDIFTKPITSKKEQ